MLKIPKFVFKLRKLDTQSNFNHLLPEKFGIWAHYCKIHLILLKFYVKIDHFLATTDWERASKLHKTCLKHYDFWYKTPSEESIHISFRIISRVVPKKFYGPSKKRMDKKVPPPYKIRLNVHVRAHILPKAPINLYYQKMYSFPTFLKWKCPYSAQKLNSGGQNPQKFHQKRPIKLGKMLQISQFFGKTRVFTSNYRILNRKFHFYSIFCNY